MYLKNAHVSDVPLLSDLFRFSGITEFDRLATTDVEATFASRGPAITLKKARAANVIAAVDAEPGGTIDTATHALDLYTILAPIKLLHDVLSRVPLVKLLVHLQGDLTRVHIQGDWDAPPSSLMRKEPLKDIGKGTLDFVRGVTASGGHLDKTLHGDFDETSDP